jgi:hypothetical protein
VFQIGEILWSADGAFEGDHVRYRGYPNDDTVCILQLCAIERSSEVERMLENDIDGRHTRARPDQCEGD